MEFGIFIKNSVIMAAILGVAFLSQQPLLGTANKNYLYSQNIKHDNEYLKKAGNWMHDNLYAKLGGEVERRSESIQSSAEAAGEEITKQKNNFLQSFADTTKKIIAEKFLETLGIAPQDLIDPQTLVCPK